MTDDESNANEPEGEGTDARPDDADQLPLVVALGASAGGLKALLAFFEAMPADSGMAFVVLQHLDPSSESLSAELLGRRTAMPVAQVADDPRVLANRVSVLPPNRKLSIEGGRLHLHELDAGERATGTVDLFFRSLAAECGERAIGIVLSGTGSDGALGLREIKAHGGLAMVQDPDTAEHSGMPKAAIATGAVDHVAAVAEMPQLLAAYASHPYVSLPAEAGEGIEGDEDGALADVLSVLKARTRYDFRRYKKNMLSRRIQRRMGLNHVADYSGYLELLRGREDEAEQLFKDLLIGVTHFFREPDAFRVLEEEVAPAIVDAADDEGSVRVWVPACSTGEEAYSIAMILLERIRAADRDLRLQVFASDIDDDALQIGRHGLYPAAVAADVPERRLDRFFTEEDDSFRVVPSLRDAVIFARHNVLADPPFSKLDLISCRNLLIYLEPEVQGQLLRLFHFALDDGGCLFLGGSETVAAHTELYEPVSKKHRVYRRIGITPANAVDFLQRFPESHGRDKAVPGQAERRHPRVGSDVGRIVHQLLLADYTPPAVLINRAAEVLYFHGDTGRYLRPPVGSPTADLTSLARDSLGGRIRAAVRRAIEGAGTVVVAGARLEDGGGTSSVRITVTPVERPNEVDGLLLVTFEEEAGPTVLEQLSPEAAEEPVVRELELELKATREELQSVIEELESSNEDLKASNEEVMSMNEELQSSNEELETSKEELQSLNEELVTVNEQLQTKIGELERANNDLANLLRSTDIATIFLDGELCIKRYTEATARLFSLRPADLGRPLAELAQKFTDGHLLDDARTVLDRLGLIEREIETDDGAWFNRRVLPYRTSDNRIEGVVITFSDITDLKRTQADLETAKARLEGDVDRRGTILELLHSLSLAANRAATVEEAVAAVLPSLARHLQARWGRAWLSAGDDEQGLLATGPRYAAERERTAALDAASPSRVRRAELPLVSSAMKSGKASTSGDLTAALGAERAEAAAGAGLRNVVVVPLQVGGRGLGGLELILDDAGYALEDLRVLASNVGVDLGSVIDRIGLQRKISSLGEEEQRRLGRELHDTVAQEIAGVRLLAETLRHGLEPGSELRDLVDRLVEAAGEAQSHVRSLARGLVPVVIDAGGLRSAMANLAERVKDELGVRFEVSNPDDVVVDDSTVATNLYYIVQEAVRNALEHGEAGRIAVELDGGEDGLRLRVVDDGRGFDPAAAEAGSGSGLRIMRYRARLIGAALDIASEPGSGTTVTCTLER